MSQHDIILKLLQEKSSMKQDVYLKTQAAFDEIRKLLKKQSDSISNAVNAIDKRIRVEFKDVGLQSMYIKVAGDVLDFQMHTNVFNFESAHPLHKHSYIRQNPKIVEIFAKIWKCEKEDLLVSYDAVSYHMPPETTNLGWYRGNDWFHCDQSYLDSKFKCVQGWVTGYDVNEGDASLSILEESNDYHKEFQEKFGIEEKDDWYKLNENETEFYIKEKKCLPKRIKCPKGSLVLWDSRTIHCGSEALKTREKPNFRNVAYVCYEPRKNSTEKMLEKKRDAFNNKRMTSHWPCKVKLFPKMPAPAGFLIL